MCQCQCYRPPPARRRRSTQCQPWNKLETRRRHKNFLFLLETRCAWCAHHAYKKIHLYQGGGSPQLYYHDCSGRIPGTKLADSSKWQKSPFQVILRRKWLFGCFWIRSRIRACKKLPEAEQLLDLCQYIIFFALHQFSCSNSHYKLESMEVPKTQIPTSKDSNLIADWVSKKVRQLYAAVSLCLCKCHHPLRAGRLHSVNSVSTSIN